MLSNAYNIAPKTLIPELPSMQFNQIQSNLLSIPLPFNQSNTDDVDLDEIRRQIEDKQKEIYEKQSQIETQRI